MVAPEIWILLHIAQKIVHPAHVPFIIKAKTAVLHWEVEGAYQVEDEKERLNEAISLSWKWKLVIGLICMSAGAGLALAERRRKEENIKKNMERNDKGKEE